MYASSQPVTGYVPAWHQPLGNGHYDAAIATTGLSRWHNYYLEGLNWLVRNVGIDGLYLDGIGYDREIMKRVRKVLQRARPGCLIDFHSGNHFHPQYGLNNCANLYIELFPCIDSLWFGEGFDYNEPPDYWMVEMAGIPYGLFGELRIEGAANVAACIERTIPAGTRLVVCRIDQRSDGGASWGPGLTLVWPGGKVLRVNLRAEGRFGVDDGRRQILDGTNLPHTWTQVAMQLDDKQVVVQAAQDLQAWQELARFPRSEFAGDPVAVRLGKMSPGSKNEDFSTLGPEGVCAIKDFRVLGSERKN